jgi:hypothetical protein
LSVCFWKRAHSTLWPGMSSMLLDGEDGPS